MGKKLEAAKKTIKELDKELNSLERDFWAKRMTLDQKLKFGEEGVNNLYLLILAIEKKNGNAKGKDIPKKKLPEYKDNPNYKKFMAELKNNHSGAGKSMKEYWDYHNSTGKTLEKKIAAFVKQIDEIISSKEAKRFASKSLNGLKDARKDVVKLQDALASTLAIGAPSEKALKFIEIKESFTVGDVEKLASKGLKEALAKHDPKKMEANLKKIRKVDLGKALKTMDILAKEGDTP